jgi:lipopolysaccharide/colanic/teichoic acid biosynthesis glycosyltransferase
LEAYLNAMSSVSSNSEIMTMDQSEQGHDHERAEFGEDIVSSRDHKAKSRSAPYQVSKRLSPWTMSGTKRCFDCVCVLLALPLLIPAMLITALAVWLTSPGPIFFLQKRMGRGGKAFTILKFRTLVHDTDKVHHAVTTAGNQRFTPVGSFLRRRKIDELPQLLNVLAGHMSLVGPRPKMREHVISRLASRPGITGAATIAFALEEAVLDRVPKHRLESYYHKVVLPSKRQLDAEYMAHATFFSDFKLIVNSVLRRWDTSVMEDMLNSGAFGPEDSMMLAKAAHPKAVSALMSIPPNSDHPMSSEQVSIF